MKFTNDTDGLITHDRVKYFVESTFWWIRKLIDIDLNTLYFHTLCKFIQICLLMLPHLFLPTLVEIHLSRFYFRLYWISVFSTSLKMFSLIVVPSRLFLENNYLVTSNSALIPQMNNWALLETSDDSYKNTGNNLPCSLGDYWCCSQLSKQPFL